MKKKEGGGEREKRERKIFSLPRSKGAAYSKSIKSTFCTERFMVSMTTKIQTVLSLHEPPLEWWMTLAHKRSLWDSTTGEGTLANVLLSHSISPASLREKEKGAGIE